jgi:pimeloyl-ACP methyl ester carboxylesterase
LATFLVAHGAWSAGWVWKKMHPLMRAAGHELFTPTYTGLGERAHLANPAIDLDWHIADMLGVLEMEDLSDVVLIGHSYGGMVATGVADRARERISKLIYLDAFAPKAGDSAFSLLPEAAAARMRELAEADGEGWRIPPNPPPPDTPEDDVAWVTPRRLPQPIKTFEQPLALQNGEPTLPRSYIYCERYGPGDIFKQFAERARNEGWRLFEIDASHNPHITAPEELRDILVDIASG